MKTNAFAHPVLVAVLSFLLLHASHALAELDGDPFGNDDVSQCAEEAQEKGKKDCYAGGYLESRNQLRSADFGDPVSLRQRLWLEASFDRNHVSGFGSCTADYDPAVKMEDGQNRHAFDIDLHHAFLTLKMEKAALIVGKTIVRWGTGDGVNPMDLINPVDLDDPVSGARSDSRRSVWLLNWMQDIRNLHFDLIWLPKGEVSGVPEPDSPWEGRFRSLNTAAENGELVLDTGNEPDRWVGDSEAAARIMTNLAGVDLSLIYFNGFSDSPFLKMEETNSNPKATAEYPRFWAIGLAFANGFGKSTVRGELALKHDLHYALQDGSGPEERDLYEGVFGWDYTSNDNTYFNFQCFGSILENGAEDLQCRKYSHGFTYEINRLFLDDDLKAGLRGTVYTSDEGAATEIFGEYKIGDKIMLELGFIFFEGPSHSILGQYDDNDMLYLKTRFYF